MAPRLHRDTAATALDQAAAPDAARRNGGRSLALAELAQAFGDLEGKVATADVWKILKLTPYARTMEEQLRLTAVMRLLGWDRRLLRFRGGEVRRGFVRGNDGRTIYVFVCPIKGEISYIGYDTAPSASAIG